MFIYYLDTLGITSANGYAYLLLFCALFSVL
jgi:hypothetical protein